MNAAAMGLMLKAVLSCSNVNDILLFQLLVLYPKPQQNFIVVPSLLSFCYQRTQVLNGGRITKI